MVDTVSDDAKGDASVDPQRRRLITAATSAVGGVGVAALAWPFLSSMSPSERAQAAGAPVELNIADLEPGQMATVEWRGKPVWIVRRSESEIERLRELEGRLADPESQRSDQPEYAQNPWRSIRPEILVMIGICTHLGCSPTFRPDVAPADLGDKWPGGFFCPCHGSRFDLAGRVFKGVPAPTNMAVPPYQFLADNQLLIGEDGGVA